MALWPVQAALLACACTALLGVGLGPLALGVRVRVAGREPAP